MTSQVRHGQDGSTAGCKGFSVAAGADARDSVRDAIARPGSGKPTASTNIWPSRLLELGFTWETDLSSALACWRDAEPAGTFV